MVPMAINTQEKRLIRELTEKLMAEILERGGSTGRLSYDIMVHPDIKYKVGQREREFEAEINSVIQELLTKPPGWYKKITQKKESHKTEFVPTHFPGAQTFEAVEPVIEKATLEAAVRDHDKAEAYLRGLSVHGDRYPPEERIMEYRRWFQTGTVEHGMNKQEANIYALQISVPEHAFEIIRMSQKLGLHEKIREREMFGRPKQMESVSRAITTEVITDFKTAQAYLAAHHPNLAARHAQMHQKITAKFGEKIPVPVANATALRYCGLPLDTAAEIAQVAKMLGLKTLVLKKKPPGRPGGAGGGKAQKLRHGQRSTGMKPRRARRPR